MLNVDEKNILHSQFLAQDFAFYAFFSGKIDFFVILLVWKIWQIPNLSTYMGFKFSFENTIKDIGSTAL